MSELFSVSEETCATNVELALTARPTQPGVSRSAVLVAGTDSIRWWRTVLGPEAPRGLAVKPWPGTTLGR